jgi:hypothetical protein
VPPGTGLGLAGAVTLYVSGDLDATGGISGPGSPAQTPILGLTGSGKSLIGTVRALDVLVTGTYTLSGAFADIESEVTIASGQLTLGGHTLNSDSLSTAPAGIIDMTNAADTIGVLGSAFFGGGNETGHLTAGVLWVVGNFAQVGAGTFNATGAHTTWLSARSTSVSQVSFSDTAGSGFANLTASGLPMLCAPGLVRVSGNLRVVSEPGGSDLEAANNGPNGCGLYVLGDVLVDSGANIAFGRLAVAGKLDVRSNYNSTTAIFFTGKNQIIPSNITYQWLYSSGTAAFAPGHPSISELTVTGGTLSLTDSTSAINVLVQGGTLKLSDASGVGHKLWSETLVTSGTGVLDMNSTTPGDTVIVSNDVVGKDVVFGGGDENGHLVTGALEISGGFSQTAGTSASSFRSTGTAVLFNGSAAQSVTFATPGSTATTSNFQNLLVANTLSGGGLTLGSDAYVLGLMSYATNSARVVHGNGSVLHLANLQFTHPSIFDNVLLSYDNGLGGAFVALDSVTFKNYAPTATALSLTDPGTGGPWVLTNVQFTTPLAAGGFYLSANASGAPAGLSVNIQSNGVPGPSGGPPFTRTSNGAMVNWTN